MIAKGWTGVRNALLILGASVCATGCYTYAPAQFTTIPIGEGVRVYLSQAGVERLRQIGGEAFPELADRPVISGRLVRRDATEFSLQVPVGRRQEGFHMAELDQQVTLPVADLVQVEHRRVSTARTGLTVVGSSVLLATIVVTIMTGARNPADNGGGEGDNILLPLFSFPAP